MTLTKREQDALTLISAGARVVGVNDFDRFGRMMVRFGLARAGAPANKSSMIRGFGPQTVFGLVAKGAIRDPRLPALPDRSPATDAANASLDALNGCRDFARNNGATDAEIDFITGRISEALTACEDAYAALDAANAAALAAPINVAPYARG